MRRETIALFLKNVDSLFKDQSAVREAWLASNYDRDTGFGTRWHRCELHWAEAPRAERFPAPQPKVETAANQYLRRQMCPALPLVIWSAARDPQLDEQCARGD
jgi:hypothetical protein